MSRRYSLRKAESNDFESDIFKTVEKTKPDVDGDSASEESEDQEAASSENEDLLVESDEEYDEIPKPPKVTMHESGDRRIDDAEKDDSDEDAAPEAVSFTSGKESALQRMRQVMHQIDSEKIAIKLKRRHIDQQFKEQKRKKLEDLSRKKLPKDFFSDLPDETVTLKSRSKNQKVGSVEDEEEGSLADTEEEFAIDHRQDVIPLEDNRLNPGVEAVTVQSHRQKTKSSTVKAHDFRNVRLNQAPRESTKSKFAKTAKKKAFMARLR